MVKKAKGIKISKNLEDKFKFTNEGHSNLGSSTGDSHDIIGTMEATGSVQVTGEVTLHDRISGFLFSPPHIDAAVETAMVQDFIDNAATTYDGFLIYVTNAAASGPFVLSEKFYFCEDGTWHASPFSGEITNYAPILNPTYEISVSVSGTDSVPFQLNLPADLFIDADGDYMTYSASLPNGDPLPAWLSFDATNTILSGTPTESDIGLLNVLVTATDPSNESGSTTQEIQILAKPTPFWEGATHEFNTYGDSTWATILPSNLMSLNPQRAGSQAWHKITAPDEFNVGNRTISIDFSFADWYNSSGAGGWGNNIGIGFQCVMPNSTDEFMEFSIGDDGLGKWIIPNLRHKNGNATNKSGGWWQYDPYDPPEDISNMEDFDFRIEIGRAAKHYSQNKYYVPVLVLGKRRTSHQDLIDAGLENISFEDIRTWSEFQQLYYDLGTSYPKVNKHFFRAKYSMLISMGDYDLSDLNFSPYVRAVQQFPLDNTTPVAIFDKFDITVDESPVEDVNVPFGDFTVDEGQPITITVPSDLFTDPDGLPLVSYVTKLASTWSNIPSWLSFDATTGVYTGTPSAADVGSYEIAVWGNDDASESAGEISNPLKESSRSFILTVVNVPGVPDWETATHNFGTSGDPSWLTVDENNLPELNPATGGYNAWYEAIAPDQFDINGSRTVIEFSTDDWALSSGSGNDNKLAVLLRKTSDVDNDFIGIQIHDDGGSEYIRIGIAHAGYSGNTWQVTRNHSFSSDSYGPADENTDVSDLKYRLELGTLIPNPASAVHYVLPVMIMALRKTPPPTVVNEGYGDFTFEQLRDEDQYWAIPASIRDKYFLRKTYYWSVNNSANLPLSEHTTFQPSIWALKKNSSSSPLMSFETFQISQDAAPEVNTNYIFVDWAATEGQPFSQTIPADLFVDPEGETPLTYVATQDDFSALPSWLSFDPETLTFSGTPAGTDAPGLTVMVRAFDSATEAAYQVYGSAGNQKLFTLTVTAVE